MQRSRIAVLIAVAALGMTAPPAAQAQDVRINCVGVGVNPNAGTIFSCGWTAIAATGQFTYAAVATAANYTIACDGGGGLSVDIATAGADSRTFNQAGTCTLTFNVTTGPAAHVTNIAQQNAA